MVSLLRSATVPVADGAVRLTLEGEFDSYSSDQFRLWLGEVIARGVTRVELDLRRVTFIDSGGLSALISGMKSLRRVGGDLVLVQPTAETRRVFEITGLHKAFTIR